MVVFFLVHSMVLLVIILAVNTLIGDALFKKSYLVLCSQSLVQNTSCWSVSNNLVCCLGLYCETKIALMNYKQNSKYKVFLYKRLVLSESYLKMCCIAQQKYWEAFNMAN